MNSLPQAARRRKTDHIPDIVDQLTSGGRIVFLRTRRPAPTCNLIAALAGLGREAR